MTTSAMNVGSIRPQAVIARSLSLPIYSLGSQVPLNVSRRSLDPFHSGCIRIYGHCDRSSPSKTSRRALHQSSSRQMPKSTTIPHISAHIAASSSGKGSKFQPEKSTYDYNSTDGQALGLQKDEHSIYQKRRARPDSGQDAYFVAPVGKDTGETAFGICDGVGGWTDHGVDPADFSHGLCSYMAKVAMSWQSSNNTSRRLKPRELLETAYQDTVKDPQIKAGGSTACVGIVDSKGHTRIANLGDSGFVQLRLGTVQHYSNPQTHAFNTPYQMSLTPPEILAQAMIFGGLPLNDLPERADIADHSLQHGDVLVLATDGVWDNLSSQDILSIVSNSMRATGAWQKTSDRGLVVTDKLRSLVDKAQATSQHDQPGTLQSMIASSIVGEAKSASLNRKRDGPFAKAWQLQMPYDPYHGGKVDDIAVLVIISVADDTTGEQIKAKL